MSPISKVSTSKAKILEDLQWPPGKTSPTTALAHQLLHTFPDLFTDSIRSGHLFSEDSSSSSSSSSGSDTEPETEQMDIKVLPAPIKTATPSKVGVEKSSKKYAPYLKLGRQRYEHVLTPPTFIVGQKPGLVAKKQTRSNDTPPVEASTSAGKTPSKTQSSAEIEKRIQAQIDANRAKTSFHIPRVNGAIKKQMNGQPQGKPMEEATPSTKKRQAETDNSGDPSPVKKTKVPAFRSYAEAARPTRLPTSRPWGDKEIRLINADSASNLPRVIWRQMEAVLLQSHATFLKLLKEAKEQVTPFLIQRIYYSNELLCGIIEVVPEADVTIFRDRVIPMLDLPIKLKALVHTDRRIPVVSAFTPQVYQAYTPAEYVELLKMVNPLLEEETFELQQTVAKENGRLLYFRTTPTVLEFIKSNTYILRHVLGQTIFNRRIEFEASTEVYTMDLPAPMDEMLQEPPSVDGDAPMKDVETDPVLPHVVQATTPQPRDAFTFSSQEIHDLLGPPEQPQDGVAHNEELDYRLLEDDDDVDQF
jgi:hypothetical protein